MTTATVADNTQEILEDKIRTFPTINITNLHRNADLIRLIRHNYFRPMKAEAGEECYEIANSCFTRMAHTGHHNPKAAKIKEILSAEDICNMCDDVNKHKPTPYDDEMMTKIKLSFLETMQKMLPYLSDKPKIDMRLR